MSSPRNSRTPTPPLSVAASCSVTVVVVDAVVPGAGSAVLGAGAAAGPEDWTTSKLSAPFAEPGATGAVGRAVAGETAGAVEVVWANEIVRVPSNAAAAQLIRLR